MTTIHRCVLLVLLIGLSACAWLGPKQFNQDGTEASSFAFEYPIGWEVLYDSESTWAFQEKGDIEVGEDGYIRGFSYETAGVGMKVMNADEIAELYGNAEMSPLEMLQEQEKQYDDLWQAYQEGNAEKLQEATGLVSLLESPPIYLAQVYESPTVYSICDNDVALMKSQVFSTFVSLSPWGERWEALTVVNGEFVRLINLPVESDMEKSEAAFNQVICSLQLKSANQSGD